MISTPGGAQTRSKAPGVWGKGERYATWAEGSRVEVDGKWYTDWVCALAALGLGHQGTVMCAPGIQSLPTHEEEDAARALLDVLPPSTKWNQVRWVTTGSEATLGAMMIARKATGRRKVLSVGYHGWHEAHLASRDVVTLPVDSLYMAYEMLDATYAAVLIEPMRNRLPDPETLKGVLKRATRFGVVTILDEIVTGFRYALGGATELYGLLPDLACYGKAMSNGFPIAAIVGHSTLMRHAVDVSGTYNGWPPALNAVIHTIMEYQKHDVIGHMDRLGTRLLAQCPGILTGWPCHPVFVGGQDYTTSQDVLKWVDKAEARGHLLHPSGFNIMLAHTEADVDSLSAALNAAS